LLAALIESAKDLKLRENSQPEIGLFVPSLRITMTAPWIGARVSMETVNFGETRTYNVKGSKAGYVGLPSMDLLSNYTITGRTIFEVSRCLRDEPLAPTASLAKSAAELLEELPTEPLRKLRTEPRPILSARQERLIKKFQERHASDPTARAKRKEEKLAKSESKDQ
jgi:hypothetical protein